MRSTSDLALILRDVESLAPADKLRMGDATVWAILRTYVAMRLRQLHPEQVNASRQPKWYRKWMSERELPGMDKAEHRFKDFQEADYLTIGYPWQRTEKRNGVHTNPHLDPLHALLKPRKGLHLETVFSSDKLLANFEVPTLSLLSRLERARIKRPGSRNTWSPELFQWCRAMEELFNDSYFHTENVANWLDLVHAAVPMFTEIFEETKARAVILDGYGDPVFFAAIFAARQLNIPAVAIHNQNVNAWETDTFDWNHLSDEAYAFLPSVFWHRTRHEAELESRRYREELTRHMVVGDPWREVVGGNAPDHKRKTNWNEVFKETLAASGASL